MSRKLIDAEKLKKHYAWWEDDERRTLFDQIVDAQPTIDAVPVIRCRDCKYWLKARNEDEYSACSIWFDGWGDCMDDRSENDYCSRAKRKEHETD